MQRSPHSNDDYTVGWISGLHDEFIVAMAMLDEEHGRPQSVPELDSNAYHLGNIGGHNIVMSCVLRGQMGTGAAVLVAENMRRTFKNIKFVLLVGIGGGVPDSKKDIRLGDVVVGYPKGIYSGVVQYDLGEFRGYNDVQRRDLFYTPPRKLAAAIDLLRAYHSRPKNPVNNMPAIIDELGEEYAYPNATDIPDRLFRTDSRHELAEDTCSSCDESAVIPRKARRLPSRPRIHYGLIASGSLVMINGMERDRIDECYSKMIYCFEMEAAGLTMSFPSLVVRGISDYSDSHKNDEWRKRAIVVSSAYAKELLSVIEPYRVDNTFSVPPWIPLGNEIFRPLVGPDENNNEKSGPWKDCNSAKQLHDLLLQFEIWLRVLNIRSG